MSGLAARATWSAALAVLVAGCVVRHDVQLELANGPGNAPAGFFCRAPSATGGAPFLIDQVSDQLAPCATSCEAGAQCRRASFVFDFVETGGLPSCRAGSIASFCEGGTCRVTLRRCFEVDTCIAPGDLASTVNAAGEGLHAASGGVILEEAPDGPVLVRMVGSAQSCDEITRDGLDARALFGCAYSCPAQLDAVEGTVQLDLDAFDDECGATALACALFLSGQRPVP